MKSTQRKTQFFMILCLFSGSAFSKSKFIEKAYQKLEWQSKFKQIKGGGTFYRTKATSFQSDIYTLSPSKSYTMVPFIEVGAGLMWDNVISLKSYPAWLKAGITAHYGYRKNGLKVDYNVISEPRSDRKQLWHTVNDFNITPYLEYIPLHNETIQVGFKVGLTLCPKLFTTIKRYDLPEATQQLVSPGVYAIAADAPQFSGQTYYAQSFQCFGNFGMNIAHSPKENLTISLEYYTTIGKVRYKKEYYSSNPDENAFLMSQANYTVRPDQLVAWADKPRLKMRAQHLACAIICNF